MLSISKLCQVVKLSEDTDPSEAARKALEGECISLDSPRQRRGLTQFRTLTGIDDRLDLISVHDRLRTLFQEAVASQPRQQQTNVDEAVELATRALAPQLAEFPALRSVSPAASFHSGSSGNGVANNLCLCYQLFVKLGKDLVSGKTLQAEDLVDLLTLKANQGDQAGDFATALDVLSRARVR